MPDDGAGRPAKLAEAVIATQEAHFTTYDTPQEALKAAEEANSAPDAAVEACAMKLGLVPGQGPVNPPPTAPSTTDG